MLLRRLNPDELDAAQAFATEGLRAERYPQLIVSPARIRALLEQIVGSERHFHFAAFDNNRIVGGIAALTIESPFFERCESHVVMFRAAPPHVGVGALLAQLYRWWLDDTPAVRRAFFPLEFDARRGMSRWLRRFGFATPVPVGVFYKG